MTNQRRATLGHLGTVLALGVAISFVVFWSTGAAAQERGEKPAAVEPGAAPKSDILRLLEMQQRIWERQQEYQRQQKDQGERGGYWSEDSGPSAFTPPEYFSSGPPPAFGSTEWRRDIYRAAQKAIEDAMDATTPLQTMLLACAILTAAPVCSARLRAQCVRIFRATREAITIQSPAGQEVRLTILGIIAITGLIALAILDGWDTYYRGRNWDAVAAPLIVWVILACTCIWRTRHSFAICTQVFQLALARARQPESKDAQH